MKAKNNDWKIVDVHNRQLASQFLGLATRTYSLCMNTSRNTMYIC